MRADGLQHRTRILVRLLVSASDYGVRPKDSLDYGVITMAWFYLILAGVFEIGWPVGLKTSQQPGQLVLGIALAVGFMVASGVLLWLAQKTMPIGKASRY